MRNILVFLFILSTVIYDLAAQPAPEARSDAGDLSLRIKSISFIEDLEYINPVTEGYTLLGFFLQPELVYTPSARVTLRGGVHALKYYGTEEFSQVQPVFSIKLDFTDKTSLTLGTLSGPDKHLFFDPHFFRERLYNAYVEDGMQLRHVSNNFFTDTWLSWENFIVKGDSTREQFTLGESFRYNSDPVADFISFEVPVQLQLKHFGGQITEYSQPVQTFINISGGLRVNFDLAEKRYGQLGMEYLQFANKLQEDVSFSGIKHGYASWTRMHYSYKSFSVSSGYWYGHNYYAPNGNPIFSNVSDYQPGLVIHDRRIITNSASFKLLAASYLELFCGCDLYYDIDLHRLDQAYTIHLNFDKLIKLISFKRRGPENQY
jgi:hypothetical protein